MSELDSKLKAWQAGKASGPVAVLKVQLKNARGENQTAMVANRKRPWRSSHQPIEMLLRFVVFLGEKVSYDRQSELPNHLKLLVSNRRVTDRHKFNKRHILRVPETCCTIGKRHRTNSVVRKPNPLVIEVI
jgi:hypothetical protein